MIVLGASLKSVMESLKWISSCQVTATMSALHPMHGRIYPTNQSSIIWLSPNNSLFLEAVNTEEQGHDTDWLSKDLI
jgi:hypothetical protein